jgi:hypothetical protein
MQMTSIKHYTKLCISQTPISYSPGATHVYLSSPGWPCQDLLSSPRTFLFDKEKVNGPCLLIDESALTKGKPSAIRAIQLHLAGTPQNASQWIKEPENNLSPSLSASTPINSLAFQEPAFQPYASRSSNGTKITKSIWCSGSLATNTASPPTFLSIAINNFALLFRFLLVSAKIICSANLPSCAHHALNPGLLLCTEGRDACFRASRRKTSRSIGRGRV